VLIRAAAVHTMTGPALRPGSVLVVEGRVAQIAGTIEPPPGARVIDLGSGVLLPGLVDAYTHAGLDGATTESTEEITPGLRVIESIDWRHRSFRAALATGTTTLCVAPGTDNVFSGIGCAVRTAGEPAQRVVAADLGLFATMASDPGRGNQSRSTPNSIFVRLPTNRMGVVWLSRHTFDEARRSAAKELEPVRGVLARKTRWFAVSRTEYDLRALLRLADEFGLQPIACGADESYRLASDLATRHVPVVLGPGSTASSRGAENTQIAWNRAGILHAAGVRVALSGGNLLEQARFAYRFGLPADAALAAVTRAPAELIGLGDRAGVIALGRDADLVALSGEPLELATIVRWVMLRGDVHYESK
jgi:imidazolonepropionase-like amidohydrolase